MKVRWNPHTARPGQLLILDVGSERHLEGDALQLAGSECYQRGRVIPSGRQEGDHLH